MLLHQKYLILIDDAPLPSKIAEYFGKFDYQIVHYTNLSQLSSESIPAEAILINASLIGVELTIIHTLYKRYPVPLIVISDKEDEQACVRILEAGADDFLIKPVHPRELHARIGAISRRVQRSVKESEQEKNAFKFANLCLYPASRQLFDDQQKEVLLSTGEYDLLLTFLKQPQQVLDREFLLQITKSNELNPFDRRIDVQISRLRQKIETDARKPALIKTIRNEGYLFTSAVFIIKK